VGEGKKVRGLEAEKRRDGETEKVFIERSEADLCASGAFNTGQSTKFNSIKIFLTYQSFNMISGIHSSLPDQPALSD